MVSDKAKGSPGNWGWQRKSATQQGCANANGHCHWPSFWLHFQPTETNKLPFGRTAPLFCKECWEFSQLSGMAFPLHQFFPAASPINWRRTERLISLTWTHEGMSEIGPDRRDHSLQVFLYFQGFHSIGWCPAKHSRPMCRDKSVVHSLGSFLKQIRLKSHFSDWIPRTKRLLLFPHHCAFPQCKTPEKQCPIPTSSLSSDAVPFFPSPSFIHEIC